ncbi:bifunctional [glutamate--ammonia ligase]-adenylyl-L-tyrosine phosphorylase/[glutamate--ammonia-ligase] adenylyltransferase [Halieaceae bacterium IMCC14734]|uniref:Bifunctional glutamine synthetase adenylyltransferase/adenylyl-removing enzyme n=1 Tax=Candidatus Litorirhabdus singularis TaxID=2518993 RepID=A0ABT3TC96_9GAMM|nr:bifunctional [glutamate--ammonia ligase]-adenylyl-L-tyrosine phosphorylase/[glutamate--ammonia-ligase] adenylyltransferase [Candidatus Litorirhabdus singularis]MCX2979911.1 bifunctional [glutamate--ammonia ligase]-adenylyl-L-tyrosine phosphorylase/[glutamate--ammonia-ligase] adenylyltransferase [Candidatus Litorirhabdus singularis]
MFKLPGITDSVLARQWQQVLAASKFAQRLCQQQTAMVVALQDSGDLQKRYEEQDLEAKLTTLLAGCDSRDDLGIRLRQFRQREILRILWRDFTRAAATMETTRDMSLLAEACLAQASEWLHRELATEYGEPLDESGQVQQLLILAMGKLGARELNLSSDIDLIFTYPEQGKTSGGRRSLSNQEFFIKLGQRLITALDQITAYGFVFRVDMRLRPYGDSGALVMNFSALEEYYQDQGREWERYAMIKARIITGPAEHRRELEACLRPFVYRRYIDFGVIDALRDMKSMISAEMRRRGLQQDVKLGPGGIREVEFIAQCFQLIRGGRNAALQQRELLPVLDACADDGCLPAAAVLELQQAYLFLRDVEHGVQGYDDRQIQELPSTDEAREALLIALGFGDWASFMTQLDSHRQRVSFHFANLIADPGSVEEAPASVPVWPDHLQADALREIGFHDGDATANLLQELRDSSRLRYLQAEGRERLDRFMPDLLQACGQHEFADLALQRLLPLVQSVARRSAYLVLLLENPAALQVLVSLCAASPWIAELLTRQPVLLDELLDERTLYGQPGRDELRDALQMQVARLPQDDLEAQMEALRYFKASQMLHIAAGEVSGRLPLMQVSDRLTFLAEAILEQAVAVAWHDLTSRHGRPRQEGDGSGFLVLGYGKLGGLELGHGSDLDLVFVYDAIAGGSTDGPRPLDNAVFYTRLGQRVIQMLDTRTAMGQLYEVDMRLRPDGNSGMLVTSFKGYGDYLRESAWTWEQQALVRARAVAGDADLAQRFVSLRAEILCRPRPQATLASEVVSMREKMREHLLPTSLEPSDLFHLKQGLGGIVDIEFMVQYAVLAWSRQSPELTAWTDNVRILENLQHVGLFTPEESTALTRAYIALRSAAHQLALQQSPGEVEAGQFKTEIAAVTRKWNQLLVGAEL